MAANKDLAPQQVAVTSDAVISAVRTAIRELGRNDGKLSDWDLGEFAEAFAQDMFGSSRTLPVGFVEDFAEDLADSLESNGNLED